MHRRAFTPGDQDRMHRLLITYRTAGYVARYPTLWRFQLLLDSRVWDTARDVQIWEDDQGRMQACALLWKRRPDATGYTLERIVQPDPADTHLHPAVLTWAMERIMAEADARRTALTLAVIPLEKDPEQDTHRLESLGFTRGTGGYNVYMKMPLTQPVTPGTLPRGFQLLPLTEADLEGYQAVYGFTAVHIDHQRALLQHPEYQHFVIKASDSVFAAYLECSFCRDEWVHGQPHVGWIDYVQTQPEYLRQGLGRALMRAGMEYLRIQGANVAMLITHNANAPALALYEKVGMDHAANEYVYLMNIDAST
jgi:ribosomal protein S18 acetylase RimI-like enzyme